MRKLIGFGALCATMLASSSFAGVPFATDDADIVEYGHFENNFFTEGTHADGQTSGTAIGAEVNYGLLPDFQINAAVPLEFEPASAGGTQYRLHDVEIGAKYKLVAEDESGWVPEVSVAPAIDVPVNAATGARDTSTSLPVWAQKSFGDWTTFGGGGFTLNPGAGNRDFWSYGIAVVNKVAPSLTLGTELFGQTRDSEDGRNALNAGVGGIYDLSDAWHLMASVNTGVVNRAENNDYSYFFGVQWTL